MKRFLVIRNEFIKKVDPKIVEEYAAHYRGVQPEPISHEEFKLKVGKSLAIIHTGDAVPYSSVILKSG